MKNSDSRLVYSTEHGRIRAKEENSRQVPSDGIVRIRRETKGRKGKGVTTISGLALTNDKLKQMTKELKQLCGTGGSIKDGVIEIQGDHRSKLKQALEQRGHEVKLAGG